MRLLPPEGTSNQYQLKSLKNGNEWVVHEEDIFRSDGWRGVRDRCRREAHRRP